MYSCSCGEGVVNRLNGIELGFGDQDLGFRDNGKENGNYYSGPIYIYMYICRV